MAIHVVFDFEKGLALESDGVTLRELCPMLNGARLDDARGEIVRGAEHAMEVRYTAPALGDAAFHIQIERENDARWWLQYRIENGPDAFELDSFGVQFRRVDAVRAYLRHGYFSWDGSQYVDIAAARPDLGYGMTQLLTRHGAHHLVLGFDRHDRFQHTFSFAPSDDAASLTIQTLWDRKARHTAESCESERLVIFEHADVEEGLREWARLVANAAPTPPRHSARITGWCSWYNLYAYISEESILEHLHGVVEVAQREQLPMRIFQIDDGFTPEMGDWLEVKPQFPRGMKPVLDEIRAAGFVPGLWIGPFMVGNRSHLFRDHPDWVVRERATGEPLALMKLYAEFRWHKRSEEYYILDTTHPDAFEYLRTVFRIWRHEWGCEYFKTDFMYFGCAQGPDRAVWHTPGMTRIEIWRRVAEMIREEIGDAQWLGCGCPLWAPVGLVDGMRIGRDVGVVWKGELAAESLIHDLPTRNFANGILWQADPDCVLLRERFHYLTDAEVRALAVYSGMSGGVLMTSDALDQLSPERVQLWKFLFQLPGALCRFPLLGQSDDALVVQVRPAEPYSAIFIFNTGDHVAEKEFALTALGLPAPQYVFDWSAQRAWDMPVESVALTIPSHTGVLLFVSPSPLPR